MSLREQHQGQDRTGATMPIGTPYCSNCRYDLTGATGSPVCPECGRPLVEVLARVSAPLGTFGSGARRYRSRATVCGMAFIDIATGPRPEYGERIGRARGFIAIGDAATGVIALGGRAVGVVAFGGVSAGVFAFGGCAAGVVTAVGGVAAALGGIAFGGLGIGGIGAGGAGVGVIASGGLAVGYYARGAPAIGMHCIQPGISDPAAASLFDSLGWLIPSPFGNPIMGTVPMLALGSATILAALLIAGIGVAFKREPPEDAGSPG